MNRYSPGYLITTDSEVYRCVGQRMVVVSVFLANTETSAARQAFIQHVPADESPDDQYSLVHNINISAKGTTTFTAPIILEPGDAIYARASVVNKVVATVYIVTFDEFLRGRF
tara:strand:+ start:237 stop:575 length:339 start_codon:yes stop_codon:yes gene_type:complete